MPEPPENSSLKSAEKRERKTGQGTEKAEINSRVRHRPETRAQMLDRLTNPLISMHEASVLLRVCTATVRRYSDSGELEHVRTAGGQRRFRLRDVLALLRKIEARTRKRY